MRGPRVVLLAVTAVTGQIGARLAFDAIRLNSVSTFGLRRGAQLWPSSVSQDRLPWGLGAACFPLVLTLGIGDQVPPASPRGGLP